MQVQKLLAFFSKNISVYAVFNDQSFNDTLTNDILSFEQLGPDILMLTEKADLCLLSWYLDFVKFPKWIDYFQSRLVQMCQNLRKSVLWHKYLAEMWITLCISAVWSEALLGIWWIAEGPGFVQMNSKDSSPNAWLHRLIWSFTGYML